MYKKLQIEYNIDKLILIYEIPDDFLSIINDRCHVADIFNPPNVFIFSKKVFRNDYVVPGFELKWREYGDYNVIKIAEFKNDIKGCITLTVHNEFLYSKRLHLLYEFERMYQLQLDSIKQLDVCCDANTDLPRKLNTILHDRRCEVSRRGRKKAATDKGNQYLGTRVTDNIKQITDTPERPDSSFYYISVR